MCGPGCPGGETLDPPRRRAQRHPPNCRVFQVQNRFRRCRGHQVLDETLVQWLHQLAQARKGQGQEARGRCAGGFSSHGRFASGWGWFCSFQPPLAVQTQQHCENTHINFRLVVLRRPYGFGTHMLTVIRYYGACMLITETSQSTKYPKKSKIAAEELRNISKTATSIIRNPKTPMVTARNILARR